MDGAIRKAPYGGEVSGRYDHDSPLLEPTLAGIPDMIGPLPELPRMHLDRG